MSNNELIYRDSIQREFEEVEKNKFLSFMISDENYAIEIEHVIDIIQMQDITEVPEQPEYVEGIINLRGKIIPTMNVRKRFKKEVKEYDDRTCIVVVEVEELKVGSVGIIVDRVSEVLDIKKTDISKAPEFTGDHSKKFVDGVAKSTKDVIILLNCKKLLVHDGEHEEIEN